MKDEDWGSHMGELGKIEINGFDLSESCELSSSVLCVVWRKVHKLSTESHTQKPPRK